MEDFKHFSSLVHGFTGLITKCILCSGSWKLIKNIISRVKQGEIALLPFGREQVQPVPLLLHCFKQSPDLQHLLIVIFYSFLLWFSVLFLSISLPEVQKFLLFLLQDNLVLYHITTTLNTWVDSNLKPNIFNPGTK